MLDCDSRAPLSVWIPAWAGMYGYARGGNDVAVPRFRENKLQGNMAGDAGLREGVLLVVLDADLFEQISWAVFEERFGLCFVQSGA